MGHDASKVAMGANLSSFKVVDNKVGAIEAGLVVRQKSDGTISLAKADGAILGVSFGKDLSDAGRTNICRSGLLVPLLVTAAFTPVLGAQVNVSDTTGRAGTAGAGFTAVNAVYASAVKDALKEDGTTVLAAAGGAVLIDFVGGL